MVDPRQFLTDLYAAFNRRDLETVLAAMHPDVDWPNAWEGGRVHGRSAVRAYWQRQFAKLASRVDPVAFSDEGGDELVVEVRQVVHDPRSGELINDSLVRHRYRLEGGLIVRMDVLEG